MNRGRYRCPNVTAATVPEPCVTSSRPAFEEERGKERERQKKTEREIEKRDSDRKRERAHTRE